MQPDPEQRIRFFDDLEVMEVDFSDITFADSAAVNFFYDAVDARLAATDRKWFFLVNYRDCVIHPDAWIAFANRGKKTNLARSLGTVRYAAASATGGEIAERARTEKFDANLFPSREAALARIEEMRAARPVHRHAPVANVSRDEVERRVTFHPGLGVMEADFSGVDFTDAATVNAYYDVIDHLLWKTGRRWYFLVNYSGCRIEPEAWASFAHRGRKVNMARSLGTVRFDASPETAAEIARRAEGESFDPNLCASRTDALARIDQMRLEPA